MVNFTKNETKDLIITIAVITLLFAYMFNTTKSIDYFLLLIPVSLVSVGLGFVLHELGHKYMAQKYGFFAEFKKWNEGLIIAVITSLFGFIFLAPGAVYISSYKEITDEENGKISLAGPVVNIALAIIFLALEVAIKPITGNTAVDPLTFELTMMAMLGFSINSFLAFFNLLPIPMLDGSKIFKWNKLLWFTSILTAGILTYLSYIIPGMI